MPGGFVDVLTELFRIVWIFQFLILGISETHRHIIVSPKQ